MRVPCVVECAYCLYVVDEICMRMVPGTGSSCKEGSAVVANATGWGLNGNSLSHPGGWESEVRVCVELASPEAFLRGVQTPSSPVSSHGRPPCVSPLIGPQPAGPHFTLTPFS